jgi:2-dehydropantoate 2-reductase
VDPQGTLSDALPTAQLVAGVVHMACSTDEPGVVLHRMGRGLILGRCAGGADAGVDTLVTALCDAGLEATASPDIRRDIWYKLWGNMTMNPVTALTGATMDVVLADPLLRRFCSDAMREAAAIGARIGCPIDQSPEDRHQITAKLGPVKTSMLQDVEAQRPLELDAIVGAVHEIAGQLGLDVPNIGALFGLVRLMARTRGLYPST